MEQDGQNEVTEELSDLEKEQIKLLTEYSRAFSQGISQRVDLQQKLLNFNIIFLGIVAAFAVRYSSSIASPEALPGLLMVPMISMFFIWSHSQHDLMIVSYARYVRHHISPRLRQLTKLQMTDFEDYLSKYRRRHYSVLTVLGGEYNLAILISLLAIFIAAKTAYALPPEEAFWYGITNASFRLLIWLEIALLVVTIFLRISVARRYIRIPDKDA